MIRILFALLVIAQSGWEEEPIGGGGSGGNDGAKRCEFRIWRHGTSEQCKDYHGERQALTTEQSCTPSPSGDGCSHPINTKS
jgi:hypothetical protein